MFRRKEEGDTTTPGQATAANGASHAHETTTSATASVPVASATASHAAPSSASASHSTAAATAPVRTASEPARAPASAMANFRTSPIAEFNRPASARSSEPARPTAASAPAASSFSATEKTASKTSRRVLTVGNDILLKGEIATCDRLVIEGRVEAKLSEVHTVEIAECGSFKGTAEVEDAEISGIFEGDLVVRNRLVIYASGEVRGNISYGEIEIERGGRLTGQIKTVANTANAKSRLSATETSEPKARQKESAAA